MFIFLSIDLFIIWVRVWVLIYITQNCNVQVVSFYCTFIHHVIPIKWVGSRAGQESIKTESKIPVFTAESVPQVTKCLLRIPIEGNAAKMTSPSPHGTVSGNRQSIYFCGAILSLSLKPGQCIRYEGNMNNIYRNTNTS